MTHEEAVRTQAVERYLLRELSDSDLDAFEEHYFSCPECAEEVRAGAVFTASARALLAEQAPRVAASRFGWLGWRLPVAATGIMLLAPIGYLLLVFIPGLRSELARLRTPQAYPAVFLRAVARGDDQVLEIPRGSQFVGLSMDVAPEHSYPSYLCEIVGESGSPRMSVPVPAPRMAGAPLNVLVPSSQLRPGRYTLILRGHGEKAAVEISRFRFTIQFRGG
jgi:anti-sigma factor RsiW